jgi:hypothetical protein
VRQLATSKKKIVLLNYFRRSFHLTKSRVVRWMQTIVPHALTHTQTLTQQYARNKAVSGTGAEKGKKKKEE